MGGRGVPIGYPSTLQIGIHLVSSKVHPSSVSSEAEAWCLLVNGRRDGWSPLLPGMFPLVPALPAGSCGGPTSQTNRTGESGSQLHVKHVNSMTQMSHVFVTPSCHQAIRVFVPDHTRTSVETWPGQQLFTEGGVRLLNLPRAEKCLKIFAGSQPGRCFDMVVSQNRSSRLQSL